MRDIVDNILSRIVIIVMLLLVIDVLLQVFAGFFLKNSNPFSFTGELAEFLLIWVGLLGAAYASGKKQHLSIELINNRLTKDNKRKLNVVRNFLVLLFSTSVLIAGGIRFVVINIKLNQISSALEIPMWYIYLVLPVSGFFISYYALDDIIKRDDQVNKVYKVDHKD